MAEKKEKKTSKSGYYNVSGASVQKKNKFCPKCGAGVFIAEHKDRFACGKCGFTEWKSGGK